MIGPLPGFSTRIVWIVAAVLGVQRPARTGDAELVRELIRDGRYARAAESARSALDALGPCAPERVELECLQAEALRRGNGKLSRETLAVTEHAAGLAAELFGADDLRTAEPLLQLGALRCLRGEFAEAKTALERSLQLLRTASRNGDPREATALSYVAFEVLSFEGDSGRALARLDEAEHVLDRLAPGASPERAWILDMRGNLTSQLGRTEEALSAYSGALAMRRRTQRCEHPLLILSLLHVGTTQDQLGRLAEARSTYEGVLDLLGGGVEIAWTAADVRSKLGSIWALLGENDRARSCFEKARTDLEASGQRETAAYARTLEFLARFAFEQTDLERARELYRAEIAALDAARDAEPSARADAFVKLAWVDLYRGSLDDAGESVSRAREILSAGGSAKGVADCDEVEAAVAYGNGDLEHSRDLLRRVVEARDGSGAWDGRARAQARYQLSRVSLLLGDLDSALEESLEAERSAREDWARSAVGLEEFSSIVFEENKTRPLQRNLCAALAAAVRSHRPKDAERVWNALLLSRDRVFRESAERLELARASATPGLANAAAKLADARLRLAGLYVQSRRSGDAPALEEAISRARSDREAAERELSSQESSAGASAAPPPDLSTLRRALESGAALVRFCLAHRPVKDRKDLAVWLNWEPCYYALVLAGTGTTPEVLELGSEKEMDALVDRLRRAIRAGAPLREYDPVAAELRRRILDPLLPSLRGARVIDLVPDSDLHLVPFQALCSDGGTFLVESGPAFHVLQTEQDLLPAPRTETTGQGLLALGDPEFANATDGDAPGLAGGSGSGAEWLAARSGPAFGSWPPLPQTRTEVEKIAAIWKAGRLAKERVDLLVGAGASERALRQGLHGHRVVHIATHGFYEDSAASASVVPTRGVSNAAEVNSTTPAVDRSDGLPFLRSGLVLAGAGASCAEPAPVNDGILTTEEVLGLDLSGVEWVVLSACDTGIGEIHGIDGVLGLRRAFRIAGARTVIASLWPVDDRWAREYMEALYRERFVDRRSTPEAMQAASRAVIAELRSEGLEPLPRWWASFVAVGDPR